MIARNLFDTTIVEENEKHDRCRTCTRPTADSWTYCPGCGVKLEGEI